MRLELAELLRCAGIRPAWYQETLIELESLAASQDVHSRLDDISFLVRRYARDGEQSTARRLVLEMISKGFGVGYRKDYQFDHWVAWLGRALREPNASQLVKDAAWLAQVIRVVNPMTEGAPGTAAADLPAAIVPTDSVSGVRIFEYLVRHGTVSHLDALASLVRALASHANAEDKLMVELAADITAEILAPAANKSYPDLAASLVASAECAFGQRKATKLVESIAMRTERYALPSTRMEWQRGLGLARGGEQFAKEEEAPLGDNHFGDLELCDGRRVSRSELGSHIRTVDDIITFRRNEAPNSFFSWAQLIDEQPLTRDDVRKLSQVFGTTHRDVDVLASLAEAAERKR